MPFGFANQVGAVADIGGRTQGPDLEVIQTERLGFLALNGDAKVQLTSKWSPAPAETSSLLSISSRSGLVAAAGPDTVHIARVDSIRKAFESEKTGDSDVRQLMPQLRLALPVRIAQLSFTADEQYLLLSSESGGGLAVYEVASLAQGSTQVAFELGTNGEALRALVPNPMPENAGLCAMVTTNGNLLLVNLGERQLVTTPSGVNLRTQVSCVGWSTRGKQLVAGMADGSLHQMTPDGAEKGHIPKPPNLGDLYVVGCVTWLENNVFLVVHNHVKNPRAPAYHIITRQVGPPPRFTYQKLADPVEPFITDKVPHHAVMRLKDFPPNLQDLLLVSSTATDGIGILSRCKAPMASNKPAESITHVFTTTELADDSRRAQLPMGDDYSETFPIGTAIDLSSREAVFKPIPSDEIEYSPGPLPGLWVLNNEGVLAAWWIVYDESIRSRTTYPGLAALSGNAPVPSALASAAATPSSAPRPAFGAPASIVPAFGGASALGVKSSPWANAATSATPFAKPAPPAFGQSGWPSGSPAATAPHFGQPALPLSSASLGTSKVFGAGLGSQTTAAVGFAGFASKNGFASVSGNASGSRTFGDGSKPMGTLGSGIPDLSMDTDTAFPPPSASARAAAPSLGGAPFVLGSTFTPDPQTAADNEAPSRSANSFFRPAVGLSLDWASVREVTAKDEEMDSSFLSQTLPATPAIPAIPTLPDHAKSMFAGPIPSGTKTGPNSDTDSTTPTTTPAPSKFGNRVDKAGARFGPASTGEGQGIFGTRKMQTEGPTSVVAPPQHEGAMAPLPPEPTIKKEAVSPVHLPSSSVLASEARMETGATDEDPTPAVLDDAPLPPDFIPKALEQRPEVPSIPDSTAASGLSRDGSREGEEEGSRTDAGSEGSGVDVAKDLKDISPSAFHSQSPGATPQSSFGQIGGSTLSSMSPLEPQTGRSLFGDLGRNRPQIFPRPERQSPRSPSPVRSLTRSTIHRRADSQRSASASALGLQASARQQPMLAHHAPVDANVEARRRMAADREAAESMVLVDAEDEGIQRILQSKLQPTPYIDEFIAVNLDPDPPKSLAGDGVPSSCEALYRDINRMIDKLGLNSRSIQSFLSYHSSHCKPGGRTRADLDAPDDWVLVESVEVGHVLTHELAPELEAGRVKDVVGTEAAIQALNRDLTKLRTKYEDISKLVVSLGDPDQLAVTKSVQLSAEQMAQQNELRRAYATFCQQLAAAEEALTLLKTKLASLGASSGKVAVPTVDSVIRTINRMTSRAEKQSGDIDVLESKMRRLRASSTGLINSPGPGGSREASPFTTPKRVSLMPPDRMRDSLLSVAVSSSERGTPPPRKMNTYTDEEREAWRTKVAGRKARLNLVLANREKLGPKVSRLVDDK